MLKRVLPARGLVLELGSGSGQHVVHFARAFPQLKWWPSDPDSEARASIQAWTSESGLPNVRGPLLLDAERGPWPTEPLSAVLAINVIHISPWPVAEAIFRQGAALLDANGILFLYGPYKKGGAHTAPSNESFDQSLRSRDARWGVRDLEAVVELGRIHGVHLAEEVAMPANNLSLVFRRSSPG